MKNKLVTFWQDNQKPILQISGAVIGGLIGLGLTVLIMTNQYEDLVDDLEDI